jgi:uncharacterized membrane protein
MTASAIALLGVVKLLHPAWPVYLQAALGLHIASGMVAFICAPVALLTAKGGRTHRRWGKVYFWAMAVVAATALFLSILLPILFLALVAVFSFYAAFAGYRVLSLKGLAKGARPRLIDWAAALITFATSAALAAFGALRPSMLSGLPRLVPVVLGCLGVLLGGRSILLFLRPPAEKQFWWFEHMTGMIASYIAACSAFSVVNLGPLFGNAWWVWLWPVMAGVPAISVWKSYYRKKFSAAKKTPAVVSG